MVKEKLVQRQEQLKDNLQETLQRVDLTKYEEVSEAEVEQAEEHAAVLMDVLSAMKRDVVEIEDTIRQQEILGTAPCCAASVYSAWTRNRPACLPGRATPVAGGETPSDPTTRCAGGASESNM